jgi:predicted GNAT family N-acyltransferase
MGQGMGMAEADSKPEIRIACSREEKEAIYRFRYQIYVDEMGKRLTYADNAQRMLYDEMDEDADHYMVVAAGEVVASARLNQGGGAAFSEHWRRVYRLGRWNGFPAERLSISSRLMVAVPWRGSAVLSGLLLKLFEHSRDHGVQFNFLNCSPSLLEFYEQLGYRRYADGFVDEDVGYRIPMVFMTEDADFMRLVRSPFWRLARKLPSSPAGTEWFEQHFPGHATHVNKRLIDADVFWDMLEHNLHADPTKSISLLADLTDEEAHQFLETGTVLPCKAGDVVIRPGDVGDEMFVVLEGVVEVWGGSEQKPLSLAILGPGQVFGEIAFVSKIPRTARVVADTDVRLLILTQAFFKKAMKNMPAIVARVLLNLSVVLCDRLSGSTRNWIMAVQAADRQSADQ